MIYMLCMLLSLTTGSILASKQAICIVPVADVLIKPIEENNLDPDTQRAYEQIPISWGRRPEDQTVCPRGHQLLFNEIVTILEEKGPEVLIDLPNILYEKPTDITTRTSYWTLKKNLLALDILPDEVRTSFLPTPLSRKSHNSQQSPPVVTLKLPFYDKITQKTYSAGTRFVFGAHNNNNYIVYILDQTTQHMLVSQIPDNLCFLSTIKDHEEKVKDFIGILKLWTDNAHGSIPLVWGGSSFTHLAMDSLFNEKFKTVASGNIYGYWERSSEKERPFAGFDASGLIYRAAQICELPFYYRNTYTTAKYLRPLAQGEKIAVGDLIKVVGGMFVVSSLEENKLITALAYSGNYGSVIETTLNKFLQGINTYEELVSAYHKNKSLQTLRPDGSPWNAMDQFTILKLSSIWELSV